MIVIIKMSYYIQAIIVAIIIPLKYRSGQYTYTNEFIQVLASNATLVPLRLSIIKR